MDNQRPDHCPQCGTNDLELVRGIVSRESSGSTTTALARSLTPPYYDGTFGKGTVVLLILTVLFNLFSFTDSSGSAGVGILVDVIVAAILGFKFYMGQKKREALNEMLAVWNTLYYCRADDIVVSSQAPSHPVPSSRWHDLVRLVDPV